jgi:hypothetical protein
MMIDPRFLREFDLWYNSDLIHLEDRERMIDDAVDLGLTVAKWPDAEKILAQLDHVLETRRREDIRQFSKITNVGWHADETMTALLFDILTALRDQLATSLQSQA